MNLLTIKQTCGIHKTVLITNMTELFYSNEDMSAAVHKTNQTPCNRFLSLSRTAMSFQKLLSGRPWSSILPNRCFNLATGGHPQRHKGLKIVLTRCPSVTPSTVAKTVLTVSWQTVMWKSCQYDFKPFATLYVATNGEVETSIVENRRSRP